MHMKKSIGVMLGSILLLSIIAGGIFWMRIKNAPQPQGIPDTLILEQPIAGTIVTSPLRVTGSARGTWYFEASFPVRLLDVDHKEIAVTPAQAQGEWMTEEFVPFEATLTFDKPSTSTGFLVIEKDNPSGLPENDKKLELPIMF